MKKLLIILLFIPFVSFGQECPCQYGYDCNGNECQTVTGQSTEVKVETEVKTEVNNVTRVARPLVLSDEKTTIKTPLTADLSIYTHILIVDVTNKYGKMGKWEAKDLEKMLSLTIFEIMNPYEVHKRAKKEPNFLKTVKDESYLYLYLKRSKGRGDDVNTTFIIRDWKNKQIYNATHINTGLNEILAPLIDY